MLINLSNVLTSEGMQMTREIPLEMRCFESRMGSFAVTDASCVSLVITNADPVKRGLKAV